MPQPSTQQLEAPTVLQHLAPVRTGLVPVAEPLSYAKRLAMLLEALQRVLSEMGSRSLASTLLTCCSFSVGGPANAPKLLLHARFETNWVSQLEALFHQFPSILDLVWSHCDGYEQHLTGFGYVRWHQWIEKYRFSPLLTTCQQTQVNSTHAPLPPHKLERVRLQLGELRRWFAEAPQASVNSSPRLNERALFNAAFSELMDALCGRSLHPQPNLERPPPAPVREGNIQGGILRPYPDMVRGCVVLLQIEDPKRGREFITNALESVTTAEDTHCTHSLNITITHSGLRALGVHPQLLAELPIDFCKGSYQRALQSGAGARDTLEHWLPPAAEPNIDLVLFLETKIPSDRNTPELCDLSPISEVYIQFRTLLPNSGVRELCPPLELNTRRDAKGSYRDHFGLPLPGGLHLRHSSERAKQVLLQHRKLSLSNLWDDSSFLVLRQFDQDHLGLNTFVRQYSHLLQGVPLGASAEECLYAKLLSGTAPPPVGETADYTLSPRSGPGQQLLHESALRPTQSCDRVFCYGPHLTRTQDNAQRGLLVLTYNQDLSAQFEQWQAQAQRQDEEVTSSLAIRDEGHWLRLPKPASSLVQLVWSQYLLAPSLSLLRKLGTGELASGQVSHEATLAEGKARLESLLELERSNPNAAQAAWQSLLHEPSYKRQALWTAIEQRGGVLHTSYGTWVDNRQLALQIINNQTAFAPRNVYPILRSLVSGLQPNPSAHVSSEKPSSEGSAQTDSSLPAPKRVSELLSISKRDAAHHAMQETLRLVSQTKPPLPHSFAGDDGPVSMRRELLASSTVSLSTSQLIDHVVSCLTQRWFGVIMPNHGSQLGFPNVLEQLAYYLDSPCPNPELGELLAPKVANLYKQTARAADERLGLSNPGFTPDNLLFKLVSRSVGWQLSAPTIAEHCLVEGARFAASTASACRALLSEWGQSGMLLRQQFTLSQGVSEATSQHSASVEQSVDALLAEHSPLGRSLSQSLRECDAELLVRECVEPTRLHPGDRQLARGSLLFVNLSEARTASLRTPLESPPPRSNADSARSFGVAAGIVVGLLLQGKILHADAAVLELEPNNVQNWISRLAS